MADTTTLEGIEVLTTGTFRDKNGKKVVIDHDKLCQLAANEPKHPAQINHDHVRKGPSMGQITNRRVVGDKLLVDEIEIDADTAKELHKWPFRSAEIDPATWTLEGMARLGAARPAVKGLRKASSPTPQLAFAAPDDTGVDMYFLQEESNMDDQVAILSEEKGKQAVRIIELEAQLADKKGAAEILELKEEKKTLLAEKAQLVEKDEIRDKEAKAALAAQHASTAILELTEARRITPAHKEKGLAAVLAALELNGGEVEWDGKTVSLSEAVLGVIGQYDEVVAPNGKAEKGKDIQDGLKLSQGEIVAYDLLHPGQDEDVREKALDGLVEFKQQEAR